MEIESIVANSALVRAREGKFGFFTENNICDSSPLQKGRQTDFCNQDKVQSRCVLV